MSDDDDDAPDWQWEAAFERWHTEGLRWYIGKLNDGTFYPTRGSEAAKRVLLRRCVLGED